MANRQDTPRKSRQERPAPVRRTDVIRCEKCGEDYSVTYKRCPFCDERPSRGGVTGRRVANTRGGGYGGPVNPIQIAGLVVSLILIIVALFIIFTKIGPLLHPGGSSGSGSSAVQSTPGSQSQGSSGSQSAASTPASSGDISQPAASTPEPGPSSTLVEAISLSKQDFTLTAGESYSLIAALSPSGVTEAITWSSSDTSVATVDETGKVTNVNVSGVKKTVTITASCGGRSAECLVRCASGAAPASPPSSPSGPVAANTPGVINAEKGLNIRSGPGSQYEKVASAAHGAKVTILEDTGTGWYKIEYKKGQTGYVSSEFVIISR